MADLLDEVKQDLNNEANEKVIKKYLPWGFLVIILILVGTYFVTRKTADDENFAHANEKFYAAFVKENLQDPASFDAGNGIDKKSIFAALVKFKKAAFLLNSGAKEQALEIYEEIAKNADLDQHFRDYAKLKIAHVKFDVADSKEVAGLLHEISQENRSWRLFALELDALRLLKLGEFDDSVKTFRKISEVSSFGSSFHKKSEAAIGIINSIKNKS